MLLLATFEPHHTGVIPISVLHVFNGKELYFQAFAPETSVYEK